jgi:hypothetical protein
MHSKKLAWQEVISRFEALKSAGTLNEVYEGAKEIQSIPDGARPWIMFEADNSDPINEDYDVVGGNRALENFTIYALACFTMFEKDKATAGKTGVLGALEWEELIKDTLTNAPKFLNNKVVYVKFGKVYYLRNVPGIEPDKEEVRYVLIEINLWAVYSNE